MSEPDLKQELRDEEKREERFDWEFFWLMLAVVVLFLFEAYFAWQEHHHAFLSAH